MKSPYSATRVSTTWVSTLLQNGHFTWRRSAVHREPAGEGVHAFAHGRDVVRIARLVQHVGDQVGGEARLLLLEAAGGERRGADAHAAGYHRLFRIVGDRVLVDRHVGLAQD